MKSIRDLITIVEDANAEITSRRPRSIVNTPAFKRWFKGSKVVDAQGKPLRVYHGTNNDIRAFDNSESLNGMIFFATDPKFASGYAKGDYNSGDGGNVIPCYLRVLKLFDFRKHWELAYRFFDEVGGVHDSMAEEKIRIALYGKPDVEDHENPLIHSRQMDAEEFAEAVKRGAYPALECDQFVNWLTGYGVDGMVILENGSINYCVFSPNQVKSAISNSGKFDADNENITEGSLSPGLLESAFIAYHGTASKFERHEDQPPRRVGSYRLGFYFSASERYAETYAISRSGPEPRVIKVSLSINNPFDIVDMSSKEVIAALPISLRGKQELRSAFRTDNQHYGIIEAAARFGLRDALIAQGYDGIIYTEAYNTAYIVFNDSQITSISEKPYQRESSL